MNERTILRRQDGFSIVELMIAATIGLFLVAGITLIFLNSSKGRDDVLRQSQQNDNGRYAIELLNNEFHTAGFLGEFDPAVLITPVTKPDPCLTDLPSLRSALSQSVQGYDNAATVPSCLSDVRAGTDILVVRRASTCAIGDAGCDALSAGTVYFQASSCNNATELQAASYTAYFGLDSTTSNLTLHLKDCATIAPLRRFRTHIFFVANNDKAGDGIPTLKRAELGPTGFTIVPLVEGIENLQIEYGIDAGTLAGTSVTGTAGAFTANPDLYATCTAAVCQTYWRNVVTAKVNILARTTTSVTGYSDGKTYTLGNNADGSANVVGPFNDAYRRHVYAATVRLFNVAGRSSS